MQLEVREAYEGVTNASCGARVVGEEISAAEEGGAVGGGVRGG